MVYLRFEPLARPSACMGSEDSHHNDARASLENRMRFIDRSCNGSSTHAGQTGRLPGVVLKKWMRAMDDKTFMIFPPVGFSAEQAPKTEEHLATIERSWDRR